LAVHRAKSGFVKEQKFNENVGLPTTKFKSYNGRFETASIISRVSGHVASRIHKKPEVLIEFASIFLGKGLSFMKLSTDVRDGEVLEEFIVERFFEIFGNEADNRRSLIDSESFWKQVCKKIGNFVCPQNYVIIYGEKRKIHGIPTRNLKEASKAKLWSDLRKRSSMPVTKPETSNAKKDVKETKLRGGGKYGYYSVLSTEELIGGAGGNNKYFKSASTVKNSHNGSKSKCNKPIGNPNATDPDPYGTGCSSASEVSSLDVDFDIRVDDVVKGFVGGGNMGAGNHDAVFSEGEIKHIIECVDQLEEGREVYLLNGARKILPYPLFDQDCGGAPFCGLTCVDTAARLKVDAKRYASMISQKKVIEKGAKEPHLVFTEDIITKVGTQEFLRWYCGSRGLGVCMLVKEGKDYVFHSLTNNRTEKFCVLVNSNNHWTLLSKRSSNANHMYLKGDMVHPDIGCEFLGYGQTIKFGPVILRNDNTDVRSYTNQRDDIVVQGLNQMVTIERTVHLAKVKWNVPFTKVTYVVDSTRAHDLQNELVLCNGDDSAINAVIARLLLGREINSSPDPSVIRDTRDVMKAMASKMKSGRSEPTTKGLIMVNAPNMTARIPNLDVVAENQKLGLVGGGCVNHVDPKRFKLQRTGIFRDSSYGDTWRDVEETGKEVCVAPIGCPIDENHPVSSGLYSVTNEPGLVAGFVGRAMSKAQDQDPVLMKEYCDEAIGFINSLADRTELNIGQEDSSLAGMIHQFRSSNKGKKSARWIDRKVEAYVRYRLNIMTVKQIKRFKRHGCFVKFESNIKEANGGKVKVRPRLIMTMSDLMQFELCWMSNIANAWYDGPIADYQVKHMNSDAMISKIREMQDRKHCVTDYSAFESSIGASVRVVEMTLLRTLCAKAGYYYTLRMLDELELDIMRTLDSQSFSFRIYTRCSGDYWTSLGNGIVSITLMKYCHDRSDIKHLVFKMLAEGDDGCVPDGVPDTVLLRNLGFKFSSSVKGTRSGDTDFLRSLWDHRRWLNIGRVLSSIFWVKKGSKLRLSKQKFLLRTMALSLHHLSPGHPVLWAVVKRIEFETRGCVKFKSADRFLDSWKAWDLSGSFPDVRLDETMVPRVAEGAAGVPGIPSLIQSILEKMILRGDYNFRGLLNDFDDFRERAKASKPDGVDWSTTEMEEAYSLLGLRSPVVDLSSYLEHGVIRKPSQRNTGVRSLGNNL